MTQDTVEHAPFEAGLFIDGAFVNAASGETLASIDPSTGETVAITARADRPDARRAVDAARRAFDAGDWATRSPADRRDALLTACDLLAERQSRLAELEARDTGIPIRNATVIVATAIQHGRELVERAAQLPTLEPLPHNEFPLPSQNLAAYDPYGVVSVITPFNAPMLLSAWKIFPALAVGNTVVHKPSPLTPSTAVETALAFQDAGIPAGVFNVLPGGGREAGEELVTNPNVDRVAFTGSTDTGRAVMRLAADTIKSVSLELGGKSANILLDDADLDVAIPGALWAVYQLSGQTCQAGSRLFVPRALMAEVVDRLVDAATQLRVGPAMSWETDLGPIASRAQFERVERYIRIGRDEGATLACGGHRITDDALARGYYVAPTIFTDVAPTSRLANEEVFGPVLSVIGYDDVDQVVAMANAAVYGLAGAVWSTDIPRALAVARRIQAGTVWVNDFHMITTAAPYGGYKQSGLGKELGDEGVRSFVRSKHIWVDQGRSLQSKMWAPVIGLDRIFGITYD